MTNEEAAKMIRDDMRLHHDSLSGEYRKALNLAIMALETVERIETRKRELEKKLQSSFSLIEAAEHYALVKLLRRAEDETHD